MTYLAAIALALLAATPVAAQTVNDCDSIASAANLVMPWEDNSRDFAKGAIRIALLDTYEPACCSYHLLVISPDPEFGLACHVISAGPGQGWVSVRYKDLTAGYDPAKGLLVPVEAATYDPETGAAKAVKTRFGIRINQATGSVTLE